MKISIYSFKMISKTPIDNLKFKTNITFTKTARQSWSLILKTLKPNSKILLPSYIGITDKDGSGIYDPVCDLEVKHNFYKLNNDLTIPLERLKEKVKQEKYSLILLVHYFGFSIKNIDDIVLFCKRNNIIIVEDCAHLYTYNLGNLSKAGTYGDYAFFSLHKFFPFDYGGLLVKNNQDFELLIEPTAFKDAGLMQNLISFDANAIAKKRKENYVLLDSLMSKIDGIKPLKSLEAGDIPNNYPVIVEDGLREKLYFWLIDNDLALIALYYRLIEPLKKAEFKSMQYISDNILNLPVHQDITNDDIKRIAYKIEEGLSELNI